VANYLKRSGTFSPSNSKKDAPLNLQQHSTPVKSNSTKKKKKKRGREKQHNAVENRSVVFRKSWMMPWTDEKVALDRGVWVSLFTATATCRGFRFLLLFGYERNEGSVLSILNNAGRQEGNGWVGR
jgi:hypothetical protein